MRILVTGVRGFIGTNLAAELRFAGGHDVVGIDIEDGDLRKHGIARRLIHDAAPEIVVHLAAQVGRLKGEDDIAFTIESNAIMSSLVAKATAEAGARFVYTSTSEVYGDFSRSGAICHEDRGPWGLPHNLYGLSKRWGEEASKLYAPRDLQIIRPSMPYGPGAPPGRGRRAMDNMLWQANHRQEIPVHRGAKRSWCWIGDLCRAWRMVIESEEPGAYNIGRDDDERSMTDIARMACELTNAPFSLVKIVEPPGRQTVVKRLSTEKIRAMGWRPEVEIHDGFIKLWDWIKTFDENGVQACA